MLGFVVMGAAKGSVEVLMSGVGVEVGGEA